MYVTTVSNENEADEAKIKAAEKGYRLACISNAGLVGEKRRLTFLPESAFTGDPNAPLGVLREPKI